MSVVGTGQFFGSPEEEREKLLRGLLAQQGKQERQRGDGAPAGIPVRTLNDGRSIPQLGFGVFKVGPEETEQVVSEALAAGYRHLDTAAVYGNEEGVGRAIAESGIPREDLFITTKLWNDRHHEVEVAFEESLGRLGLDYVDLYLIHWPAPRQNRYVQAWAQMEQLGERARSIGVCNFLPEHLDRLLESADTVPVVNQIELHPALQQRAAVAASQAAGIAVEAWGPLGQGRYDLGAQPPIAAAARAHGKSPAQVVLRWHLQQGFIVFPKTLSAQRMRENLDVFDFELDDAQMAAITALERGARGGTHPADKD